MMIEEGSKLILVDGNGRKYPLTAARKMVEVSRLGVVEGKVICDSTIGDSVEVGGKSFLVMAPSLKDLLSTMERRAQIITPKDSFQVPSYLDIGSGSRVLEAGAGSGAMTLVLLHAVAPGGKVFTYETREDHAKVARRNVAMSPASSCWNLRIGDICVDQLEKDFDAAMIDIPNPWDAVGNVISSLRIGGHLGCYIPNANQLERTVLAMRDARLAEVEPFETLHRSMVVHDGGVRPSSEMLGHTGYLVFARKTRS
jgi:tRNA (adenine57-N1/adenine58-N1)-methyltransferase